MAHGKRNHKNYDALQMKCQDEARQIISDYYCHEKLVSDIDSIYVVWFAFIKNGWKCMVSSYCYKNHFFEITKNERTGEICYNCFKRYQFIVRPSEDKPLAFKINDDRLL